MEIALILQVVEANPSKTGKIQTGVTVFRILFRLLLRLFRSQDGEVAIASFGVLPHSLYIIALILQVVEANPSKTGKTPRKHDVINRCYRIKNTF